MADFRSFARELAAPLTSVAALRAGALQVNSHGAGDDGVWRGGDRLIDGLVRSARRLLRPEGMHQALVEDRMDPGSEILRWRFVTLRIPQGLLTAAAAPAGSRPPPSARILPRMIAPVGPVAHLHLHLKAAGSFEGLWTHCARSRRCPEDVEKEPRGIPRSEWMALLNRAWLARSLMASLTRGSSTEIRAVLRRRFGADASYARRSLNELVAGRVTSVDPLVETLLRRLGRSSLRTAEPHTLADLWLADPIADGGVWPEGVMLARVFRRAHRWDEWTQRLVVQYLRVKSLLHAHLVFDPDSAGLDAFDATFKRLKPYRIGLEPMLPDLAAQNSDLDVRAVELRVSPPDCVRRVIQFGTEIVGPSKPQTSIVVHFIRDDPKPAGGIGAVARSFAAHARAATVLRKAFELRPDLLDKYRGLDVAGGELAGPMWILLPVLRRIRDDVDRIAARAGKAPLRLTLHVGEDFGSLLTGLRAVSEPIDWGLLRRGDRLGHALALAIDVRRWARRTPTVTIKRGRRICDLAWALNVSDLRGRKAERGALKTSLKRALKGTRWCAADVRLAYRDLGDPAKVNSALARGSGPRSGLLEDFIVELCDVDGPLHEQIDVDESGEGPCLRRLQSALVKRIARWGFAIELNPSSNFLIADHEAPLRFPVFGRRPNAALDGKALPVTISADDPITFATSLEDEYAYAWAGLTVAERKAPADARAWIQEASEMSWRARFGRD